MLQIRLLRFGKKHKPSFRLILVEKGRRPGKYLENLGFYSPGGKKHKLEVERIKNWIGKGAQLTPTVHNILAEAKIIGKPKIKVSISKSKKTPSVAKPGAEAAKSETKPAEAVARPPEVAGAKTAEPAKS